LIGIISNQEDGLEIREAVLELNIWFEKYGEFEEDQFIQHCVAAANANVQTLIIHVDCTDDGSLIRGIQQYRLLRDNRIVIIAPGRVPGDSTISTLLGLQILDIVAPSAIEDEEQIDGEIALLVKQQLAMKPSYGNAIRWDVKTNETASIKKVLKRETVRKEKSSQQIDSSLMEHIESLQLQQPLVREKQTLVETIIGTIVISCLGVEKTAGTTHTALLVANYFAKQGRRVAIIEANQNEDFALIETAYHSGTDRYTHSSFSIQGVDHYKSSYRYDIAELLEMNYDYIILDLGSYLETTFLEEFYRSHVQIIVGHGIEWRQPKLLEFALAHDHRDQSKWIYTVPLAEEQVIKDIRQELQEGLVYAIPHHPDPYRTQKNTEIVLGQFLKEYIGRKRKKNSLTLLYSGLATAILVIIALVILLIFK
jgi:hypothetical protein